MKGKSKYCPVCKKEKKTESVFCEIHEKARKALVEGYERWLKAYGVLAWEEYLKELSELDEPVGAHIKELIDYERYFKT